MTTKPDTRLFKKVGYLLVSVVSDRLTELFWRHFIATPSDVINYLANISQNKQVLGRGLNRRKRRSSIRSKRSCSVPKGSYAVGGASRREGFTLR